MILLSVLSKQSSTGTASGTRQTNKRGRRLSGCRAAIAAFVNPPRATSDPEAHFTTKIKAAKPV